MQLYARNLVTLFTLVALVLQALYDGPGVLRKEEVLPKDHAPGLSPRLSLLRRHHSYLRLRNFCSTVTIRSLRASAVSHRKRFIPHSLSRRRHQQPAVRPITRRGEHTTRDSLDGAESPTQDHGTEPPTQHR